MGSNDMKLFVAVPVYRELPIEFVMCWFVGKGT